MKTTKELSPVKRAYKDYLRHLKKEHPATYQANRELLESQLGII